MGRRRRRDEKRGRRVQVQRLGNVEDGGGVRLGRTRGAGAARASTNNRDRREKRVKKKGVEDRDKRAGFLQVTPLVSQLSLVVLRVF